MAKKGAVSLALLIGLIGCEAGRLPVGPSSVTPEPSEGAASGQPSPGTNQQGQEFPYRRILCFGDSITYGTTSRVAQGMATLTSVEGYVPKLARRLTQEYGEGFELINSGIGAETTADGLSRLPSELQLYQPDLVLLLEGVVDANSRSPRFPPLRANLAQMMTLVLRSGSALIVGTYPPLNNEGYRIYGMENVPRLNTVIRQEASKQGVLVADHEAAWKGDVSMQGPDGLHPNDNGYEKMADTWLEAIQSLLARDST